MLHKTIEEFKQNICRDGLRTELDKEIFKLIEQSNAEHTNYKVKEIAEYLKTKPIKTKKR